MNNKWASLCILAYKRPEMLETFLKSLHETIDFPCEIIINYDGIENISDIMFSLMGKYSKFIAVRGQNRGVGRSFQNCLGIAEGDYIFKLDTDLIFKPHWLSTAIAILDTHNTISAVSLFNYNHYDPTDTRFEILEEREDCFMVNDFVSSAYGFKKERLWISNINIFKDRDQIPDDGFHTTLAKTGKLAITKEDMVTNEGFGRKSVYVSFDKEDNPFKTPTYNTPLLFSI